MEYFTVKQKICDILKNISTPFEIFHKNLIFIIKWIKNLLKDLKLVGGA